MSVCFYMRKIARKRELTPDLALDVLFPANEKQNKSLI